MRRPIMTGYTTVMVVAGSFHLVTAEPPTTVRPAPTEVVMVDAVVVGRDGGPVTDLREDDFVVRADGRERAITQFERVLVQDVEGASRPLAPVSTNVGHETGAPAASLGLVFDEQNIRPQTLREARKAALSLIDRGTAGRGELVLVGTGRRAFLRAREQVGLEALRAHVSELQALHVRTPDEEMVSESEAMRISVFHDQTALETVVQRIAGTERTYGRNSSNLLLRSAEYPNEGSTRAEQVWLQARTRAHATLAVVERLARLLGGRRGRKSVVLLTEGFVLDGRWPEWTRTLDAARRANVVVYAVDVGGLREADSLDIGTGRSATGTDRGESPTADREATQGLDALTTQTGGFTRRYTNDLTGALAQIAAESRNYYLLGFEPSEPPDGKFHELQVEVRRAGLMVRARKGYLAQAPGDAAAAGPIPLRLTAFVLEPRGDAVHVQAVGEIDPGAIRFEEREGRRVAAVDWLLDVFRPGRTGSEPPRRLRLNLTDAAWDSVRAGWVPVGAEFDLPAGVHVARFYVSDGAAGGRAGMLEHVFQVPSPHAPYVSAVLSDFARAQGAAPAFVARRTFAAGAQLLYQFAIRGIPPGAAGGRLFASHELRTASGAVLTREGETPLAPAPDGIPARLVRISLEKTPPGQYEIRLHVRDESGDSRLDWVEPFEVTAATLSPAPPSP
jgi:VWFA-related protein